MRLPYHLHDLDLREQRVQTNGIELNVFTAGKGPLIILAHGFPEGWATWGPQIHHLVAAGYQVAVPEMRGYGASDAPARVSDYETLELAADMAGLVDTLNGGEPAVLIGHDWGCVVAWHTAMLYAEKLLGVGGLSVPWLGRGEAPLPDVLAAALPGKYFYITEFQHHSSTVTMDRDRAETLRLMLCGDADMLNQPDDGRSLLERAQMPPQQPDYMPQEFIDYLTSRYEYHGFEPPLNWYRNFSRTFERLHGMDDTIHVPAMFLTTRGDWTWQFTQMAGIDDTSLFSDLRLRDEIDGSHWVGQEHPHWVNSRITQFLALIRY